MTDSSKTKAIDASYNDGNQLTTWNGDKLSYDTNGNRLSDGKYTYTWDTADQLTAITKKGESTPFATYKYDDDNRRIEKAVNGQTTRYYYNGDSIDVLYETDSTGIIQRQYVYSDNNVRMAMKVGAKTIFYHYNAHGDVIALTNEAGDIVAEYSYDAWGNVLELMESTNEAKQNPFGYAGYRYDEEISMYYLMARYYEPEQGIFISVDPDPGDEDDPQTMNGYNYTNNNPVMHIDPDGNMPWWAAATLGGAAGGAAKYYIMNKIQGKKSTWRGAGKAAYVGGRDALMWTTGARVFGLAGKLGTFAKVFKKRPKNKNMKFNKRVVNNLKTLRYTVSSHYKSLRKNPKQHLKTKLDWRAGKSYRKLAKRHYKKIMKKIR